MISIVFVGTLLALALFTQAGVWILQRSYRQHGLLIELPGARLNVVCSNLEVMHQPLGDLLARKYPVIAIDRPRALGARMALDHAEHLLPDSSCRHRLPIPGAASAGTPGR